MRQRLTSRNGKTKGETFERDGDACLFRRERVAVAQSALVEHVDKLCHFFSTGNPGLKGWGYRRARVTGRIDDGTARRGSFPLFTLSRIGASRANRLVSLGAIFESALKVRV